MLLKYHSSRRNIAVVTDRFEHRYQYILSRSLTNLAKEHNVNLVFYSGFSLKSPAMEETRFNMVYELVNVNLLDGIIISSGSLGHFAHKEDIIAFCHRYDSIPVVSIALEIPNTPSILVDNKGGMKEAVLHMIEKHGKTRVGFVKGPDFHEEADSRYRGYVEALEAKGIPQDKYIIFKGNFNHIVDTDSFSRALIENEMDALAVANDAMAMEAVAMIRKYGLRVPEDLPVISFDDLDTSEHFDPPLSTVHQPIPALAEEAFNTLMQLMEKKHPVPLQVIPTHLVIRDSCGCNLPKEDDTQAQKEKKYLQVEQRYAKLKHYFKTMDDIILEWRFFSQEMTMVMEYGEIISKLAAHLQNIGIKQFYMCLYQKVVDFPDFFVPKYSHLLMAMDHRGVIVDDKNSITFITDKLLPDGILDDNKQFMLFVQPLVRMNSHYGYIIFGVTDLEAITYGIVREQVSNTIQTIRIIKEKNDTLDKFRQTSDELKNKEEKVRDMVTFLPSIILETNEDLRITYLNQAGYNTLSVTEEILIQDASLLTYVHEADKDRFREYAKIVLSGTDSRLIELRVVNKKLMAELICQAVPIIRAGKPEGIRISAINLNPLLKSEMVLDESIISGFNLSSREKEVLQYLIMGEKYKDIADKLFIAECTVKDHVKSIFFKMGVDSKKEFFYKFSNFLNKNSKHESLVFSLLKYYLNE